MADIRLAKPAAGASESVQCAPDARFVFDFPTTDATLAREGDNLNISFQDGSQLQLQGFYQEYNGENLPSFNIDGTEVAAADFFAAMNEPDLMPAAGPGTGTVANGARFHEWGDSALTGGITHLNGLDWGFSRSFEWEDHPNAVGYNGDDWGWGGPANTVPELTTPPVPERPRDPNHPGDDPNNPATPENPGGYIPNTHGATIVVDEGALAHGSGQHVLHGVRGTGAFVADVHAERGGSIALSFGGKVVTLEIPLDDSLRIAPSGDAAFANVNGVDIRILDATSNGDGQWTVRYQYALADRVEHDKQLGEDMVRYDGQGIAITVTDGSGDVTRGRLTVEVHDDVPHFTVDTTGDATSLEGSFDLTFGADRAAASDAFTAEGATATTVNGNTTSLVFAEGTLTITNNGGNAFSYTFTPSAQYENLEFSKDITLTAMDRDRDTDTLTITVGQPKAPTLKDPEPDPYPDPDPDPDPDNPHEAQLSVGKIIMDEGAMKGGSRVHKDHGASDKGSFTVDMHGEDGTITVSDGQHTALVTLEGNRAVVTDGKLHINGVDVEITGARLAGTEWTVTYKYALTERVEHADSSASGEEDTAYDKLIVTATDDDGEQASAVINVLVHDDAPHFSLKATGDKATLDGKFGLKFGADEAATTQSLTAKDEYPDQHVENDGVTTMAFAEGTLTITNNGDNSFSYTFEPNADHKDLEFSRQIELTAKDKDGDTDTITITVGTVRQPTFPDDPTPHPDDPDVLSVGRITVDEGAMADGTRHHVEHGISGPGSFKVDMHGEEKGTITVSDDDGGEVTIRLDGNSAHVTGGKLHVNGVEVEILDARPVGSEWTINYTYTLTERAEHTDPLKSDDEDVATGQLYVSATYDGEDATPATAVIDVFVHDDAPQFETHATGNKTKFDGSFGLKFGADTAAEENPLMADEALSTEVVGDKTIMTFTEGTLTITNNGDNTFSYTFTPNADHENLEFSKKIMLTATDRDQDTDTIKITVGNLQQPSFPDDPKPDPDPDPTPDPDDPEEMLLSVGRITVDEGALEGGTGDHADHGVSKTGESFKVEMHGEDGTITVFDGTNTVTITLEGTEASVSGGTLHINGVDVTITGAELEPDGTVWTVSYDYTLTERVEHDGVNAPNGEDTSYGKLIITATDDDGEQASAVLNVLVHDDAPQFSVHATGDKTKFDGDFELNFGADTAAEVNPLVAEGAISTVVDGARTIMEFTEGTLTITNNGGNSFSYAFTPNADHENLEFSKKIELTATDKDKDTDTIKITVGNLQRPSFPDDPKPDPDPDPTPDPDDPEEMLLSVGRITVDEGALAGGTKDHDEHGTHKAGESFKVEMHGEDGTITVFDGTNTATITLVGDKAEVEGGTLHINGVDVTITGAELEPDGTVWTVSYDYTLTERVEHDGVNAPNREDTAYDKLIITATDDDGEQASAVLNVLVHDDSPQFSVERTGDKTKLDGEFGLNFGADKEADNHPLMAERAISTEVNGDKTIMEFTEGTLTITNNGDNTFSYTFTPNADHENLEFSREIKLTATDKDQDTATTTIIVGQEKRPDFPDPKPDPDPDPTPDPDDPNAMRVSVGQIIADEGALEGGTQEHKDHGISKTGESFRVDMHGEDGSITISDLTNTVTITLEDGVATLPEAEAARTLYVNGVDVTITGAVRNGSQWTVSYDYVLRENVGHTDPEQSGQADTAYGRLFITATDDDDKQAHAVLNVRVHDDAPMFTQETFGTEETFKGEFGLNFGADKAAAANSLTAAGEDLAKHVESGNTTTMVFKEGTLTITNNGDNTFSYEFEANDDNKNLEFSRKIELTAKDGDQDTAKATIIVGQKKEPDFPDPKEPDSDDPDPMTLSVGDITVDEAAMDRGTHVYAMHGTGKEGESFKVDMHGEDGSITVSYGGKSVEITLNNGKATLPEDCTLRINGVDVTITGAELEPDGTVWTVKYDYQLVDNASHTKPHESYEDDTLSGALTVTARDDDGNEAHAALNVHVHDDKPMFTLATFGSEDKLAGGFTLNYGADKAATDQRALTAEDEDLTQHVESGKTTTMVFEEGTLTVTDNGGQSFSYTFTPNEKYANLEFNRKIKLTAKDGDDDTATTTIKVGKFFEPEIITENPTNAEVDGTAVVMDEALLPEGTRGDGKEYEGSNAFSVNLHGESGSIVIRAGDETVTFNIPATEESSGPFATPEAGTNTQLHVNGVTITFTQANLVSGQWQVNYKYTLDGNIHHDNPGPTGADDFKLDDSSITITVTDSQENEKTAQMSVKVLDDGPVLTGMGIDGSTKDGDNSYHVDDSLGTIKGQLENFAIGADREGATVELSVSYDKGNTTEKAVYTVQNGKLVHTDGSTNISVDENGKFSFTRPEGHVKAKGLDTYEFKAVITDSDQDHVDSSVIVSTNHKPEIDLTGIKVYESKLHVTEKQEHEGSGYGGTEATSKITNGSFKVDTHGEGGTLELTWGGTPIKIVLDADDCWTPKDSDVCTFSNSYATLTIQSVDKGTVNYTYTLDKALTDKDTGNNGRNEVDVDAISVKLTDRYHNDVAPGEIKVTVVDDAPMFKPVVMKELEQSTEPLIDKMDFTAQNQKYTVKAAFNYKNDDGTNWVAGGGGTWGKDPDSFIEMQNGVQLTSSFVHYQYREEGGQLFATNVIDVNNGILNSGKALNFSSNGLSVGYADEAHSKNTWNVSSEDYNKGNAAGEIHIGDGTLNMAQDPDKRYLLVDQYGGTKAKYDTVCGTNVSEAVVFDLGKMAFGMDINLGMFEGSERVLVTFMLTPKNCNDNVIVKTEVVTKASAHILVPEGFSKVIVSALPKATYTVSDDGLTAKLENGDEKNSGFTIRDVTFLKAKYKASGEVKAESADGVDHYEWDWTAFTGNDATTPNAADVHIRGLISGDYKVEMKQEEDGSWTARLVKVNDNHKDLDDDILFTANKLTVDKDGVCHWEVNQYYEFKMANGADKPFQIVAVDGDGDRVPQEIPVNITFNRFHESKSGHVVTGTTDYTKDVSDDVLIGASDANSLMYGKGGDDVLIGDGLHGSYDKQGVDQDVVNFLDNQLLKLKTDMVSENKTRNDKLFEAFDKLTEPQKDALGDKLEELEDQDHPGHDALYGGLGRDFLIGGAGDDLLDGSGVGEGMVDQDVIYAGSGNDIIFYKSGYTADKTYINGGSGTDILIAAGGKTNIDANHKVNVEVLLSTNKASTNLLQITGHESLLAYGIVLGENSVRLDQAMWTKNADGSWSGMHSKTDGLTLYNIAGDKPGFEIKAVPNAELQNELQDEAVAVMSLDFDDVPELLYDTSDTPDTYDAASASGDTAAGPAPMLFAAARTAPAPLAADASAGEGEAEARGERILGNDTDETLTGTGGDDFIDGGAGSDTIFAGAGDDLIVYDPTDYLIDGGSGIDFLLSGSSDPAHSLADMLGNWEDKGATENMPMVHDVEVMLKGVDTSLQNMEDLAKKYGFSMEKDADGRETLVLEKGKWALDESQSGNGTNTYVNAESGITLETTLTELKSGGEEAGEQAAQTIVLTSNG